MIWSKNTKSHTSRNEDALLCRHILAGEKNLFEILVNKYHNRLFRLGLSFFKNKNDAEDFTQEVLMKAYASLASFRGEATFSTWLMRIAYNTGINSIKQKHDYTSFAEYFDIEDIQATPEEQHLISCLQSSIRHAIALLPDRYRICIDLYFFYEMPYADIQNITGLPINTIKSHIFRAKKILKESLCESADYPQKAHTNWCLRAAFFAYDL